jgi:hypothetical protein
MLNFRDCIPSEIFKTNDEVNYSIIIQKILLPYFKMKIRIVKHNFIFSIGDMNFKVIGLTPYKYGYVSSGTFIRLNK